MKPYDRDALIAEYNDENGPTHDLNVPQQEQKITAATTAALNQAMGLTAGTTGAVGSLGTPNERLIASMDMQKMKGGMGSFPEVGIPLTALAATAGGGIAESQRTVSGTPRTTVPTYTPLDDELFMALNRMEPEGTPLREQIPADEIVAMREGRGQAPYESYEYKKIGKNWVSPDGTKVSDEVMRVWMQEDIDLIKRNWPEISDQELNRTLEASQRRIAGFGSEAQTEAARAAKQAKGEALRSTTELPKRRQSGRRWVGTSGLDPMERAPSVATDAGPLAQPNEERPLWQQREKLMAEYRRLENLPYQHPEKTSYREVIQDPRIGGHKRVTKLQDVVTKIQAIEGEIARIRNIGTLTRGPEGGRALGLGTGRTDFGPVGHYPSGTQDEFWRARNLAAGDADVAFRQDIERKLNAMRRYFNQSAIARELSQVARVPAMAGQVSRAIPAGQAIALIAEPLMLFMSVFDDPKEGIFGISFGTQLKAMASTLTRSTGKPTPLQPRHLEPEAIQRLRAEPETAKELYEFGALSEELWKEVQPRTMAPISGQERP